MQKEESTAVAIFIVTQDAGRLVKALAKKKRHIDKVNANDFQSLLGKEIEERPNYVRVAEPKKPCPKSTQNLRMIEHLFVYFVDIFGEDASKF